MLSFLANIVCSIKLKLNSKGIKLNFKFGYKTKSNEIIGIHKDINIDFPKIVTRFLNTNNILTKDFQFDIEIKGNMSLDSRLKINDKLLLSF